MREYGQVQSAFWQSTDAQTFSDHGKLLALYLLTGPHANGIGCYWLPNGYITADLDWAAKDVEAAFTELSGNGLGNGSVNGFAYRFDGVVFIPRFLKWNKIANPNVASARFAEFDALSNTEAKRRTARAMLEFCSHWSEPQRKTLETVAQTVAQTVPQTVTQTEPNPTQPNPTLIRPAPDGEFFPGVPETVIRDFLKLRNKLRAPITETAASGIRREAEKAGVTVEAALRMCCERGWRGFKAEWVTQSQPTPSTAGTPRKRRELGT